LVLKETLDTKSSDVAFRRSGSDAALLSPENSDKKSMGDAMATEADR
jgi:hypothetical protein